VAKVKIRLVNLDRSTDRLAAFTARNSHLKTLSRFRAVDGATIDLATLARIKLIDPAILPHYTPGAIGCALSHLALWDQAITDGEPLTICEDDAIFHHAFESSAQEILDRLPPGWDLVMWGWNFDTVLAYDILPGISSCIAYLDQAGLRRAIDEFQDRRISPGVYPLQRAFGLVCYTVSPAGARRLREHCLPLRPMKVAFPGFHGLVENNGIDVMTNQAYPSLSAYVAVPPLVVTENRKGAATTVQTGRSAYAVAGAAWAATSDVQTALQRPG
jgi:GR25 family glycosyltransferase involved in LPS biosynthesis